MTSDALGFETTTTLLMPGDVLVIVNDLWIGALVTVTAGSVELECHSGATRAFPTGSILWFSDLGLRAVRNTDTSIATIVSTRRVTSSHPPSHAACIDTPAASSAPRVSRDRAATSTNYTLFRRARSSHGPLPGSLLERRTRGQLHDWD